MSCFTFFDTIEICWQYDSVKHQLTVTGTLNGKPMEGSPAVLTHADPTAQFTGQDGTNSADVELGADFAIRKLAQHAQQTNPSKSATNTSDF